MHDLVIIGSGPAGLTAALYAARAGLNTLILEKLNVGGRILMTENIENFPGFFPAVSVQVLIGQMEEQVKSLGVKIEHEEAIELDVGLKTVKTDSKSYAAKAVIIATGAKPRKLGVPGEDRLTGKGVSFCAICDAPFYKEKNVVIAGGGNAVAEEAIYLARFAKSVTIIHRRNDLRASQILQERLKENAKIHFLLSTVVTQINGSSKVESARVKDVNSSKEQDIPCDGVFVYIGSQPDTFIVKDKLKLDETGFVITDENMVTSKDGIFACGDCRKKSLYQVITACGDGAVAADSAYKYITKVG